MPLLLITTIGTLLFWPLVTQSEIQDSNNLHYEFTQSDSHYAFRGTFFAKSDPTCLLHIFYDFEHLPHIVTDVDSFVLLRKGENWYDVAYIYSCLLIKGRFIYRKNLNQEQMKVSFEMTESDQQNSLLPKVVSSAGYYEIKPEKEGNRIIYFQEARVANTLLREIYSNLFEKEAIKFLRELKDYVERKCH